MTLLNTGRADTQIGGWRLRDRIGRVLVLPKFGLRAGASVKVYTGKGRSTSHALFLNKRDRPVARHSRHRPPVRRAWLG